MKPRHKAGLLCISGMSLLVGCGGGSSSPASDSGPVKTVTFAGGVTAAVSGTVNPPVTANGQDCIITGVAGGTFTTINQNLGVDDIANSQILFIQNTDTLCGVNPDGTDFVKFPVPVGYGRAMYSPAGDLIAFEDRHGIIQLMYSRGTGITAYKGNGSQSDVCWSPDGKKLAFASNNGFQADIYTMNANGTGLFAVTTGSFDFSPSWTYDQYDIFFNRLNVPSSIEFVSPSGGTTTNISGSNSDRAPIVSPNGNLIAFQNSNAIWTVDLGGGARSQVTFPSTNTSDSNPAWSPDGQKIVYEHALANGVREIWVTDVNGANPHSVLPSSDASRTNPTWSPIFHNRQVIGTAGYLGSTAAGFLSGVTSTRAASMLAFDCPPANRNAATIVNQTPTSNANIVFSITAPSITSMAFNNGISQIKNVVLPAAGATSAAGALVTFDSFSGRITAVLPYSASKSLGAGKPKFETVGTTRIFHGNFIGVFDQTGKNLRPHGTETVRTDLKSGRIIDTQ